MKPSLPRKSRPRMLTFWVSTTIFDSQCPDLISSRIAPTSTLLKHLHHVKYFSGVIHAQSLHFWRTSSTSFLLRKLLGLPVSAIQFISVSLDVVWIQILSFNFGMFFVGFAFMNCLGLTKLTIFQWSKIPFMYCVLSGSIVSWEDLVWVSSWGTPDEWVLSVSLMFRTLREVCGFCRNWICRICQRNFAERHTLL